MSIASSILGGGAAGSSGGGGSGDVTGPASSTDNALARFDGTGGKTLQSSTVSISDAGALSGVTQLGVDNLRLDGNTITTTNAAGNLVLDTDTSGLIQIQSSVQFVDVGLTVYIGGSGGDEKVQLAGGAGGTLFSSDTTLQWYNDTDISSGTADVELGRRGAKVLYLTSTSSEGAALELAEMSVTPSAPASNKGRLFLQDNGAGKTQLVVRFPTGAIQVLATEP